MIYTIRRYDRHGEKIATTNDAMIVAVAVLALESRLYVTANRKVIVATDNPDAFDPSSLNETARRMAVAYQGADERHVTDFRIRHNAATLIANKAKDYEGSVRYRLS